MKILREILKKIINNYFKIVFYFFYFFKMGTQEKVYVFDLDNTLADSWHAHTYSYKNKFVKYKSLAVFLNMHKIIKNIGSASKIIFLTSRSYDLYILTIFWLKQVDLNVSFISVFLVNKPIDKLWFIKKLFKKKCQEVHYIDDLSYNHENGQIKFYENVINDLKKINNTKLKYWGYNDIQKINQANPDAINCPF